MAGPADFFNDLPPEPGPAPPPTGRIDVYKGEAPAPKDNPASFFDDPSEKPQSPGTGHGYAETAGLHGMHGLTGGFSDELAGLGAVSGANRPSLNPIDLMHGLARMGYEKLTGGHEASDEYTKARDERRKVLEESESEHPVVSALSDVAGSMALPGGSALPGATMGARALRGAGIGLLQGELRGAGEANEMSDVPKGIVQGGITGALLGGPFNAVFGPRITSAAKQAILDAANKYGVQLPSYMVSDHPLTQFLGKTMEQFPGVGNALENAGQRAKEGVKNIRDMITGPGTPVELRKTASDAAVQAQKDFVAASKLKSEVNYNAVNAALPNPNARQIPMALWQEAGNQLNKINQYGGSAGPILQQAMDAVNVKGGLTYEALKNLRTNLYTKWRTMQGKADTQYGDYVGVISAITKDMEDIVRNQGGSKAVQLWQKANSEHSVGKDINAQITQAIGKGTGDTSASDTIFRNISATKPNVGPINTLKNNMSGADWSKVQGSVLGRMGTDDAGNFSIAKLISADAKLANAGRDAMFGMTGTPKRDAYDAIIKLGGTINNVEKYKNFSRTAPTLLGAGALIGLYNDVKEKHFFNTAGELGAGAVIAAILSRPATARSATAFSRAMDKYLQTPAMWAADKVPKAVETAARNFAITYANSHDLDKDQVVNAFTNAAPMWSNQ